MKRFDDLISRVRPWAGLAGLAAVLSMSGCSSYDSLDIDLLSSPPATVDIDPTRIEIPAGVSVLVYAFPVSANNTDYNERKVKLRLRSDDPFVFDVRETGEADEFILIGVMPGQTCMEVSVMGEVEECIPVRIRE